MMLNKNRHLLWGAALVLVVYLSGGLIGGPSGYQDEGGVAFINLAKVLNAYKGLMATEEEVGQLLKNGEEELKRAQEELDNLNNELMVYSSESPEFISGKNEVELKELGLKQKQRALLMERDVRVSQALKEAYLTIERAVGQYRLERNLRAVLTCNEGIERMESTRPDDVLKWISLVEVVSYDDRLDISDAIITIINGS